MGKLFEAFGKIMFNVVVGYLLVCFTTYVVIDIATLFNIEFITNMTYVTVFGTIFIIHLLSLDGKTIRFYIKLSNDESDDTSSFTINVIQAITILCLWGIAYFSHWLLIG
jgi:hypothetical protein